VAFHDRTVARYYRRRTENIDNLAPLLSSLACGDFDLVAVGRALIANPDWARRIRGGSVLKPYFLNLLQTLD
jgi:2,4-dienoyl-CoA reductase-like NADH-dependent reductase (Old Yellow Enzyme family)